MTQPPYADLERHVPEVEPVFRQCGNRRWLDYEDESGFGQAEYECSRPAGHDGKHGGFQREYRRATWRRRLARWLGRP
jgi:hypothetical protein